MTPGPTPAATPRHPVPTHGLLAHVVRSGFVEGAHHGTAVALGADGRVVAQVGDPEAPIFPRSANKPLQAVAMLRAGLDLHGRLLALATSSHSGEHFHRDGVRRILASVDLTEQALQTPAELLAGMHEGALWRRTGRSPSAIAHNSLQGLEGQSSGRRVIRRSARTSHP